MYENWYCGGIINTNDDIWNYAQIVELQVIVVTMLLW